MPPPAIPCLGGVLGRAIARTSFSTYFFCDAHLATPLAFTTCWQFLITPTERMDLVEVGCRLALLLTTILASLYSSTTSVIARAVHAIEAHEQTWPTLCIHQPSANNDGMARRRTPHLAPGWGRWPPRSTSSQRGSDRKYLQLHMVGSKAPSLRWEERAYVFLRVPKHKPVTVDRIILLERQMARAQRQASGSDRRLHQGWRLRVSRGPSPE